MITKEVERQGIPVAFITTITRLAQSNRVSRIIAGVAIRHPCGDPEKGQEIDLALRYQIVETALEALQADVDSSAVYGRLA